MLHVETREMSCIDSECALLGAVLPSQDALLEVMDWGVKPDHFTLPTHRKIWNVILDLCAAGESVHVMTVAQVLSDRGHLDECGGLAYLGGLERASASSVNAGAYARRLVELRIEREYFVAADRMRRALCSASAMSHDQRVSEVQEIFTAVSGEQRQSTLHPIAAAVAQSLDQIKRRHDHPGIDGVLTGYQHLDFRLQGLQPGDVLVIAGRPGSGKTTYAMNIVQHVAGEQRRPVLVFSLEMTADQLATRMIAAAGPLKMGLLKSGKVFDYQEQAQRLDTTAAALARLPLLIDDQGGLTLADITTRARREHRRVSLGLVVVDYLQLIESPNARGTRNDTVSDISRALKALAKELGCPVIVLSQLSRKCEERGNKRPVPSDLRDSGAVEQDADLIQFVYRDRMYNEATPVGDQAEIITAKNRNGECGTDYLVFDGAHNRFREMESTTQHRAYRAPLDDYEY